MGFQKGNKYGPKKGQRIGSENPNWKGGFSEFRIRKTILTRDDYTCQICGFRDIEIMEVDHIIPKAVNESLINEPSNLMTICPNCHRRKTIRDVKNMLDKLGGSWKKKS